MSCSVLKIMWQKLHESSTLNEAGTKHTRKTREKLQQIHWLIMHVGTAAGLDNITQLHELRI